MLAAFARPEPAPPPASAPGSRKTGAEADAAALLARVRRGMTPEETRRLLGPPRHTARQVLYNRYLEQWAYDDPAPLRVEFDCPLGQPASLLAAYPLAGPKP